MKQRNKLLLFTFFFTFLQLFVFAQEKELLRKQYDFARQSVNSLEGYHKNLGGNSFSYHSLRKDVSAALLTRCTDGNRTIEWETQAVPEGYVGNNASFVWLAALDLTEKRNRFDVYVNDEKKFEIISGTATGWEVESNDDGKLTFITFSKDQNGDAHGYMTLTAPGSWITPGKPLKIKMAGENAQEDTWIIVYKAGDVLSYLAQAAQYETWMEVRCTPHNDQVTFTIEAPAHLSGRTIHFEFGGRKKEVPMINHRGVAFASVEIPDPENQRLLIRDEKNSLIDVEDIGSPSTRQIIQAKSLLINEVKKENESIQISSRRLYAPTAVKSLLELANSTLGNGTIYLMNSSHQDIAWMDSPEKCILERDTMLITPLLRAATNNPDYRFDIEDALMIKEYIERHPDKEALVKQLLQEGKISCGATYIQPYEEMYSGEALARQFYFGKKWLKDRFDYDADTYWNVDVPGRSSQMMQLMKKAGVNYLMVSRQEKGIFKWFSPDSSAVLAYSPGHYSDAFAALNKNFFESAEYIASGSMDWQKYFPEARQRAALPLLSDWDMSPAKDYSQLIDKWGSIRQLEVEPGKQTAVRLPEISVSTAPVFMRNFENEAENIPGIKGERPNVWLYIHGPGHQKAIQASRRGDILLTAAEKFATMDALVKQSFLNYPQQRLTNAWEAKIYPDHGWGGKNGQVTDALFRSKFEFARREAQYLIETATRSIAGHIQTPAGKGIPIVVFNSLNWERNDVVHCTLEFAKGEAKNFIIRDAGEKAIVHQKSAVTRYPDGSLRSAEVAFVAPEVPPLGYATFYATPAKPLPAGDYPCSLPFYENDFYRVEFSNGGLSGIYDKELKVELLNTKKFKGGEVFTMRSEGNGAGEFDAIQVPGMEGFDKTGNYQTRWEPVAAGPVSSSFKMRQQIRNAVVEQTITIYNTVKRIDFGVALLNWEGELYREYRMALPLNMQNGHVAYEVPFGVTRVGKDEMEGVAGERYQTPAAAIHPRGVENWIGAANAQFGVTLSSSVAVADYIDPTENPVPQTVLQPVLLASRKSCHWEGNEYLQTGNHHFSFSMLSHRPDWKNGFRFGKQANEELFVVVNPQQYEKARLPENYSFFRIEGESAIVSAIKKSEDDDAIVIRVYDILGQKTDLALDLNFQPDKAYRTSLIEEDLVELQPAGRSVPFSLGSYSVETFKVYLPAKQLR